MYTDERVATFIVSHFLPARLHVKEQAPDYQRFSEQFGALWTPTILLIAPDGTEQHRIEGFLDADEFLSQLKLGLAKMSFQVKEWSDAERLFREVVEEHPETDAAPEAQYWTGVARYRATGDAEALADTAAAFRGRYSDTVWSKKASIWDSSA